MIDTTRFCEKARRYGIDAAPVARALDTYAQYLVQYNEKVNLTAITDPEGIEDRHFIDSLLLAMQPEMRGDAVDVGTGAGFPGVVAKLYRPEIAMTLMEPTGKRVEFLRSLCERLGIEAQLVKERAEEAARKRWREQFDVATARAVAALPALAEYCLPLVKVGGVFIAMKGASAREEAETARRAAEKLGGELADVRAFTLPDGSARSLLVYRKVRPTPPVYPRNGGKIAKSPL